MLFDKIQSLQGLGIYDGANSFPADLEALKKFNIYYAFNGSGKTTLTRLFRAIQIAESKQTHPQLKFKILAKNGTAPITFDEQTLDLPWDKRPSIRVFNTDFIWENIRWNPDNDSAKGANPIYYIGADQAKHAEAIKAVQAEIAQLETDQTTNIDEIKRLDTLLRKVGSGLFYQVIGVIKAQNLEPSTANYILTSLEADHKKIQSDLPAHILTQTDLDKCARNITLQLKPTPVFKDFPTSYVDLINKCVDICKQSFISAEKVSELDAHASQHKWVKDGLEYHQQHQLEKCLFCDGIFIAERAKKLSVYLNDDYEKIRDKVENLLTELREAISKVQSYNSINTGELYEQLHKKSAAHQRHYEQLANVLVNYLLKPLLSEVEHKSKKLNTSHDISGNKYTNTKFWNKFSALVKKKNFHAKADTTNAHQTISDNINTLKYKSKESLRLHFVAECYTANHDNLQLETDLKAKAETFITDLKQKRSDETALVNKTQDFLKPIETINSLLERYLGHSHLKLTPRTDEKPGYILSRSGVSDGTISYLSEGEKTAIAFCYFISTLEPDSGLDIANTILVIDDPISSLDTHALQNVFGLVHQYAQRAKQTFILTHNFNFFRYIRNWICSHKATKDNSTFFLIECMVKTALYKRFSKIKNMPKMLKNYDSEYHYLFSKTLEVSEDNGDLERAYLMTNAMRKVLETFLSFKMPIVKGDGEISLRSQMEALVVELDKEPATATQFTHAERASLYQFLNDESHARSPDGLITHAETALDVRLVAKSLLKLIKISDPMHFKSMEVSCSLPLI